MRGNLGKKYARAIVFVMVTCFMTTSMNTIARADNENKLINDPLSLEDKNEFVKEYKKNVPSNILIEDESTKDEITRVIVELDGKSAQEIVGKGEKPTQAESFKVEAIQEPIRAEVASIENVSIRHSYTNVFNGFSIEVERKDIEKIKEIDGVKSVREVAKYEEDITSAKKMTQIEDVWKTYSLKGEGMVIAVIDTGIDYRHKDFSNPKNLNKTKLNKEKVQAIKESGALRIDKNIETFFTEKIPFGYNYADKNNEIVDLRSSKEPHGAHVAGIAAANGDDELIQKNQAVKGVAPEAQLLAMKVFSNGPLGNYSYSDDQLAAIDDAVLLGADVINMSLGSPVGFRNDMEPIQDAIKRATDAGTAVVLSAGNNFSSTEPYGIGVLNDQITVGSPALAKDSLMVASFQNTGFTSRVIEFENNKGEKITDGNFKEHQIDFKKIYNKDYEIVDCNLGETKDFNKVGGKVALIKRGEISFSEKILNAQEKGAVGVIIYNDEKSKELADMSSDEKIKIPAIFVDNSVGKNIIESKDSVMFNGTIKGEKNKEQNIEGASDFSAWGPSPSLEFKPQISAPGGEIFSTFNEGSHGYMSGTSMAAPHVSGIMALLIEGIKEYAPELKGRELVDYAKNIVMNTSKVEIDKVNGSIPFSPRKQGAGLVQAEAAIRNRVTVTNNGKAAIELKEIRDGNVTFDLDLKNYGDKDAEYNIKKLGNVLTQSEEIYKDIHDRELNENEATLKFDKDIVVVPAKSSEKVTVTLNIGDSITEDKYLEGFIKLTSKDKDIPSLSIPYIGFYGDWGAEKITTNNAWSDGKHILIDVLKKKGRYKKVLVENLAISNVDGKDSILGVYGINEDATNKYNGEKIAISPNQDDVNDVMYPALYLMRNAKKISAEIVDCNGKVIRNLGNITEVSKNLIRLNSGKTPKFIREIKWDGTIFNKSKGNFEVVEDGEYTYRIKLNAAYEGDKEQVVEMPVKVDTVAPKVSVAKIENLDGGKARIHFKAIDEFSGVDINSGAVVSVNGQVHFEEEPLLYDKETCLYSQVVTGIKDNEVNKVNIAIFDYAKNIGGVETSILLNK